MQPTYVPTNVSFEIDNAEDDWTWEDNTFDFIHIRALLGSIKDWDKLYRQAYRCLKPVSTPKLLPRHEGHQTDLNSRAAGSNTTTTRPSGKERISLCRMTVPSASGTRCSGKAAK